MIEELLLQKLKTNRNLDAELLARFKPNLFFFNLFSAWIFDAWILFSYFLVDSLPIMYGFLWLVHSMYF